MENKTIKIALAGQPNVGKSLLVNALSHANMKVGNFTGVTVEKAEAHMMLLSISWILRIWSAICSLARNC